MKFMVITKATKDSESGVPPIRQVFDPEDLGPSFTPEVSAQLDRVHEAADVRRGAQEAKLHAKSPGAR